MLTFRKFLAIGTAALTFLAFASPIFAAEIPTVQFIEAETMAVDGSAVTVTDVDGAIGGKALVCNEKVDDASGNGFTFKFTVADAGDYTIWGRVFYPNQGGNSLFYSIDGGDSMVWDFADEDDPETACYNSWQYFYLTQRAEGDYTDESKYGTFTLEEGQWRHAPNTLTLTAGEHSIHFSGREAGWYIDQFVVSNVGVQEYDPNYYDGNTYILESCKFCGPSWQHYYKDVYAGLGITAEEYFNTALYPTIDETPAADTTAASADSGDTAPAAAAVATAPQTSDSAVTAMIALAALSLAGFAIVKKRG